ncbi:hypothetical protein BDN71DRAFT_1435655 [Pleurotus eryngii]|uniref:Uncharacterized protein n=1 Tax=Pleurotus eryngii TaxID=5323 RepID=A0A9P5ZL65_PLEER|nr:hypothetical protein BDN71DRAFT_1435655 [Pleurotus eryngii]
MDLEAVNRLPHWKPSSKDPLLFDPPISDSIVELELYGRMRIEYLGRSPEFSRESVAEGPRKPQRQERYAPVDCAYRLSCLVLAGTNGRKIASLPCDRRSVISLPLRSSLRLREGWGCSMRNEFRQSHITRRTRALIPSAKTVYCEAVVASNVET